MEKIIRNVLLVSAVISFCIIFLFIPIAGSADTFDITWRLTLNKIHLLHEWSIPYFTPGRCGGFLLAADAQDFLFTIYMLVSFFISNVLWSMKITTLLVSIIFAAGFYKWSGCFGFIDRNARLYASILIAICGYWVCHMVYDVSLWCHDLAYTPWILYFIEYFFKTQPSTDRSYLKRAGVLALLFFLLLNAGYYWMHIAAPLIVIRCAVEIVLAGKKTPEQLKRLGIIILLVLIALILSSSRLGGIYEFQLSKFPRLGGEIPNFQIVAGKPWRNLTIMSLFYSDHLTYRFHSEFLGDFSEFSNFIGILSLIPLTFGAFRIFSLLKTRAGIALWLAAWYQAEMTKDAYIMNWIRSVLPIYKQVTGHWRGHILIVMFLCILIVAGYEMMLRCRFKIVKVLVLMLMVLNIFEITYIYSKTFHLSFKDQIPARYARVPTAPLKEHFAECRLANLYGQGQATPDQVSFVPGSVDDCADHPDYYNMHDVRLIGSVQATGGYYLTHKWPLWPKSDAATFEKFVNYKQVVDLPLWLKVVNVFCIMAWIVFIGWMIFLFLPRSKKIQKYYSKKES